MNLDAPPRPPAADTDGAPGALARCVGDPTAFLATSWGRSASLVENADRAGFADLLTLDDVDRFITTQALRVPYVRLVRADTKIPEPAYTRSGRTGSRDVGGIVDPAKVAAAFADGATLVLQGLHRWHEPVTRFCRDLEFELGHPCQVNAYVTPPGAQGLATHADAHDVFVLQAFGSKRWHVGAAPAGGQPIEAELAVGDALYMPRGTPHSASAQRAVSGHLTVGIHVTPWREVIRDVLARLDDDPAVAGDVPAGWLGDPSAFAAALGDRLALLAASLRDDVDPLEVVDRRLERFLSTRAQLARGTVAAAATARAIGDATVVERRSGSVCVVRPGRDDLQVLLGDRRLTMPAWVEPAMRRIAETDVLRVGDLAAELPSASGRAVLIRRLVREGLLAVRDGSEDASRAASGGSSDGPQGG
ncbi:MAG TPA: cupin domain-containing protein [Actinomycetota bacterium]|nr:cupin domain-containing protein [Actinomycetota bacterium]